MTGKLFKNPFALFLWLTLLLAAILMLPHWLGKGMFLDGVTYATIARNMAEGRGSFWVPFYTETLYPQFFEHPPLAFGLESLLFRLFGDHFWIEKLYSALTFLFTGILVSKLWKRTVNGYAGSAWLPILLWVSIPVVHWAYVNNMLENTMGIFSLLAVFFLIKAMDECRLLWCGLAAAIFIILGILSKGPVALFPLAVPLLYSLTVQNTSHPARKAVILSLQLSGWLVLAGLLLYWWPEAREHLTAYIEKQFLPSVEGSRETTGKSRFWFLWELINQLLIPAGAGLVLYLTGRSKQTVEKSISSRQRRFSTFFLLLALAGSLPVLISPKQAMYYILPAMPFYALSLALWIWPHVRQLTEKEIYLKAFPVITPVVSVITLVTALSIAILYTGKAVRNQDMLQLVELSTSNTNTRIQENTTISVCPGMYADWGLYAWYYRLHHISLDAGANNRNEYYLMNTHCSDTVPEGYKKTDALRNLGPVNGARFQLFQRSAD